MNNPPKNAPKLVEPNIRVSMRVYVKVMETALNEAVFMKQNDGMELINAVRNYVSSPDNAPGPESPIFKQFSRYRELIDKASDRSAKARAAAQRRRERREAQQAALKAVAPKPVPTPAPQPSFDQELDIKVISTPIPQRTDYKHRSNWI